MDDDRKEIAKLIEAYHEVRAELDECYERINELMDRSFLLESERTELEHLATTIHELEEEKQEISASLFAMATGVYYAYKAAVKKGNKKAVKVFEELQPLYLKTLEEIMEDNLN